MMKEIGELKNLIVGTEVSAKYRGAFCEAQIKSIKRNITMRVLNQKDGKTYTLSEENVKGILKVGSQVEAQFPDATTWTQGQIQSLKDRSQYTVVFDDGDERTLYRGSLCLKGDRHFAQSETLDNLPLTDPENFGTPVLSTKKSRSRRRQSSSVAQDDDEESDEGNGTSPRLKNVRRESSDMDSNAVERQLGYLSDPMMGMVVIVEPTDKRKHWFPGLIVSPLCYDADDVNDNQFVVRSFKTGKLLRVNRNTVKLLSKASTPAKVENTWKEYIQNAKDFKTSFQIPNQWKMDISDIINNSDDDDEDDNKRESSGKSNKETKNKEPATVSEESTEFLECLYKFMEDRGSAINKTPVLGYKDLNLHLLYKLVKERNGFYNITTKEWHQIYNELGIPKLNYAAGHNTKTAYQKYLLPYEEYCLSWTNNNVRKARSRSATPKSMDRAVKKKIVDVSGKKEKKTRKDAKRDSSSRTTSRGSSPVSNGSSPPEELSFPRRTSRRRRISESSSVSGGSPACQKTDKTTVEEKLNAALSKKKPSSVKLKKSADSENERDESATASGTSMSDFVKRRIRRNSTNSVSIPQYNVGNKLKVKYGQDKTFKLYQAKIIEVRPGDQAEDTQYYVHYAGWNQRHDEWINHHRIMGLVDESISSTPFRNPKNGSKSTGTTPTASPFPGSNPAVDPSKRLTTNINKESAQSVLSQPRATAATLKRASSVEDSKTTAVLKQARNLLGAFAEEEAKNKKAKSPNQDSVPKGKKSPPPVKDVKPIRPIKLEPVTEDSIIPNKNKVENNEIQSVTCKSKTPSPPPEKTDEIKDKSPSVNIRDATSTPPVLPRRTSSRRSKSPAYLAQYGLPRRKRSTNSSSHESTPSPTNVANLPIKEELPVFEKVKKFIKEDQFNKKQILSFGLAPILGSDINKNIVFSPRPPTHLINNAVVYPVQQDNSSNRKRPSDQSKDSDAIDNKKPKSGHQNDTKQKENKPSEYDNFDEGVPNIDLERKRGMVATAATALLNSNAATSNSEASSVSEEVSRIMGSAEDSKSSSGHSSPVTNQEKDDKEDGFKNQSEESNASSPPSSSKILMDNTPPHTPEHTPEEVDQKSSISDDAAKMQDENNNCCEATSSSDPNPSSSPEYNKTSRIEEEANNDEEKTQNEEEKVSEPPTPSKRGKPNKKVLQRKRKRRNSKGRRLSNCTADGESESEEEQTSNRSRNKPRKKRTKTKREIPQEPARLDKDELDALPQEKRIEVLQNKMEEMRKVYQQLKQEVANIDRKRKRARKREREAAEALSSVSNSRSFDSPNKRENNISRDNIKSEIKEEKMEISSAVKQENL